MLDLLSFAVPVWLVALNGLLSRRRIRVVQEIFAVELAQLDRPAPVI